MGSSSSSSDASHFLDGRSLGRRWQTVLLHDAQRRGGDLLRCSICGYPEDFRGARRFRLRIHHRRPRLSIHLLAESVLALPRDA